MSASRRRAVGWAVLLAVAGAAGAVGWVLSGGPAVVVVGPGGDGGGLARALRRVPDGAVVRLRPGTYGPVTVTARVTIEGAPGATLRGPLTVRADGVRLVGVRVAGGTTGISVRSARDVLIEGAVVRGAELQGIEVEAGSATIRGCVVEGLTGPVAQGIDVRNANGHPRTVVRGCRVTGGQEGLVSHVSRVELRDNVVRGTTQKAISIDEMSEGLAQGNRVEGVAGTALYCGDMSTCEFRDNVVTGVAPGELGARFLAGHGAVALYHSRMRLSGNAFRELAGRPVYLSLGSELTDRFPLHLWPPGWRGALPGAGVAGASLLGLGLVAASLRPVAPRVRRLVQGRSSRRGEPSVAVLGALAAGLAVQSFHMVEHLVQVYQVYVAQAANRSGLVGQRVDTEWLHFGFNLAVLGFLAWALPVLARRSRERGLALFLSALLVQAYHVAEHTAKIVQFVSTNLSPAPGLFGGRLGLVWFHFGINLAVYVGMAIPVAGVLRSGAPLRTRPPRPALAPATLR